MGGGTYPGYTVVVPKGWYDVRGRFVVKYPVTDQPGSILGLSVWDVGQVYLDPCHWQGGQADPGPSVKALVAALVTQPLRKATKPTDATLAGYRGQYLELSVPEDLKSSTWTDFDACDVEPSNGHHDFRSWIGNGLGHRFRRPPGRSSGCGSSTSVGSDWSSTPPIRPTPPRPTATSWSGSWSRSGSALPSVGATIEDPPPGAGRRCPHAGAVAAFDVGLGVGDRASCAASAVG